MPIMPAAYMQMASKSKEEGNSDFTMDYELVLEEMAKYDERTVQYLRNNSKYRLRDESVVEVIESLKVGMKFDDMPELISATPQRIRYFRENYLENKEESLDADSDSEESSNPLEALKKMLFG